MIAKTFEVRDRGTFIPMLGVMIDLNPMLDAMIDPPDPEAAKADVYLLRRAGYGFNQRLVILTNLAGGDNIATYDPHDWSSRTRIVAHAYIAEHWYGLPSGSVIDVEYILKEADQPKVSEREEHQL
jgi:hypothetical protein